MKRNEMEKRKIFQERMKSDWSGDTGSGHDKTILGGLKNTTATLLVSGMNQSRGLAVKWPEGVETTISVSGRGGKIFTTNYSASSSPSYITR